MFLHWSKDYLFQVIPDHLQQQFPTVLADPHYTANEPIPNVHGISGDILGTVTTPVLTRVSRKKLRDLLAPDQASAIKV